MREYYITTPVYYVNDKPHLGHAYTGLAADMLARFKRMDGYRVKFVTGTDEHGQKIAKAAALRGVSCQAFVDEVSGSFQELATALDLTNDVFIRTTQENHKLAAQFLWRKLRDSGNIYSGEYAGWYSTRDEAFYQEDELVDGKAPTGSDVEWLTESGYFFKLSAWERPLLDHYAKRKDAILPESRRNEVSRFIEGGLKDLSISRQTLKWGIPVPDDPERVMYVWLDALTNYLSAIGYPSDSYREFWSSSVHLVGKDILRFHGVYWPAFLMAAGIEPPKTVFAHGWWTVEGEKMSKSAGNALDPFAIVERYGADALRYFVLRELSFGQDGDFSLKAFVDRLNADLANAYGNLCQRVFAFVYKHAGAKIPEPFEFADEDSTLLNAPSDLLGELREHIDNFRLNRYIETLWRIIADANRYVDSRKPWSLKNDDLPRMNTVLYVLCDVIRQVAILTQPVLPRASGKILDELKVPVTDRDIIGLAKRLTPGVALDEPKVLFAKHG